MVGVTENTRSHLAVRILLKARFAADAAAADDDTDFYPRDAMLARGGLIAMALCLCLRLSQVGVLWKRMNESSWFSAWELLPPILHCAERKFGYLQK